MTTVEEVREVLYGENKKLSFGAIGEERMSSKPPISPPVDWRPNQSSDTPNKSFGSKRLYKLFDNEGTKRPAADIDAIVGGSSENRDQSNWINNEFSDAQQHAPPAASDSFGGGPRSKYVTAV